MRVKILGVKVEVKFLNLIALGCHVISCVFNICTPSFGSAKHCAAYAELDQFSDIIPANNQEKDGIIKT